MSREAQRVHGKPRQLRLYRRRTAALGGLRRQAHTEQQIFVSRIVAQRGKKRICGNLLQGHVHSHLLRIVLGIALFQPVESLSSKIA